MSLDGVFQTSNLKKDPAIEIMLDYVYEEETSRKNWDSSFITSVRNQYHTKGGITEAQYKSVKNRYDKMQDGN